MSKRFETAQALALKVGELLRDVCVKTIGFDEKTGWQDIVTSYDKQAEHLIRSTIAEAFPEDAVVGEEFPASSGTVYTWYIDPIDGTTNFVNQHHDYCVSIACYKSNEAIFGVVLDVERKQLYTAEAGKGAFRNGERMTTSSRTSLHEMILTSPIVQMLLVEDNPYLAGFRQFSREVRAVRSKGSAALELCLVAAGEADLFATPLAGPWDHAAAAVILKEAGGACCSYDGKSLSLVGNSTVLAASNAETLEQFQHCLEEWSR